MLRSLLLLVAAAAMMLPAAAHSHKTESLEIVHPWARASAKGATSARVFMIVRSRDGQPDRLIAASTPRAGKVALHAADKGAAVFAVEPGKELVLYGDGPSLVLTGLTSPLQAYDDFKMMLVFERAGRVEIDVMVEE
jgi:periplasmic copper chaperone A